MKTITRKYEVYTLEELDKKGWQKAYNDWLTLHDYPHNSDNSATMNAFCKLFRVNCYRWEYDAYTFSFTMSTEHDNSIEELSGQRLATYLTNNYWNAIFAPTTYWSKNYKKRRKSRIFRNNSCVLTGYYIDDDILAPIYNFMSSPDAKTTFEALLKECLNSFFKTCCQDVEYSQSEECFKEDSSANEREYLSDGTLFN